MTSSPQSKNTPNVSPLKVVPPGAQPPTPIQSAESAQSAVQTQSSVAEAPARSISKRKVFWGVLIAIGLFGFVPLPTYITGRAEVGLRDDNRQSVSMREAGRVDLRVASRTPVRRGDVVAIIENDDLTAQILEQERLLMDAQAAIAAAERRLAVAQAVAARSNIDAEFDRRLLERRSDQLRDLEAGLGISETQKLEAEIEALRSQAAGQLHELERLGLDALDLQEQQTKKQAQLAELLARRERLAARFADLETAVEAGALGRINPAVTSVTDQQSELEIRIASIESELQSINRQIEQRDTQQAGIARELERFEAQERSIVAQINGAIGAVEKDAIRDQGEWESSRAEFDRSAEDINLALAELERQEKLAIAHQSMLQQLEKRREALHLRAEIDGIVITDDLDLKDGKWVNQGEVLFAIAPSEVYDIAARFDQGDMELFGEGDAAKFINDTPSVPEVMGRVKAIEPVLNDEDTAGDKAELEVTIEPHQLDDHPLLRTNVKGYVRISSPKKLNGYQQLSHQIGKVVNFKRYPPFIWFN